MRINWKLRTFKLKDLKEYEKNPRQLNEKQAAQLKTSLEKFGLIDRPVATTDGRLIGGHQRKRMLSEMGIAEVECYVPDVDLSEKEIEELNIRLNKNTGEWDFDVLANEWEYDDLIVWGFEPEELTGFEAEEVPEEEAGGLLEPKADSDAIAKLGDVFELNEHRLVCGDSTDALAVAKCVNGQIPILMVTDPPYGVNYDATWRNESGRGCKASGKVKNDDQSDWQLAWELFPGSVCYVWCASLFVATVQKSLMDNGFKPINLLIWMKQHFALSRGDYHWQHEPCWYAVKEGASHNWQGSRKESTVWEISNLNTFGKGDEERTAHSTQKPLECMARPIRNNSAKGERVYDPFLGSGTTLIAAESLGRICHAIELSPAYVDMAIERWLKYMKQNGRQTVIKCNGELDERWLLIEEKAETQPVQISHQELIGERVD